MANTDAEQLVVLLEAKIDQFEKNMAKATRTANDNWRKIEDRGKRANSIIERQMAATSANIQKSVMGIGTSIAGSLGLTGILSLTGFLAAAINVNHELAKMSSLAKSAGLSTDRLQEIKYAANIGGVSDSTLAVDIQTSLGLLDEAQRQVNTLSRLFNANGMSIRDQNGELIKFDELLERAATLMARAPSEVAKGKIAEMMGLSRDWIRVLENGPEAFRKAAGEASKAGIIIDEATIAKAKEFDKAWAQAVVKFKAGFTSALSDLSSEFAQFFKDLLDDIPGGNYIRKWFAGVGSDLSKYTTDELNKALEDAANNYRPNEAERILAELDRRAGKKPFKLTLNAETNVAGPKTVIPRDVQKTPFDRAVFETQKRIALTEAETATINLQSEARERAKLVAELEETAKKANTEAGYQNATVTEAQQQKINQLADALENAARKQREAQELMQTVGQIKTAFADAFEQAIIDGNSLNDVFKNLIKSIAAMALRMALLGAGGKGGLLGGFFGMFGFANGGIMTGDGAIPLRRYENGGIARKPQLAMFGEGKRPEAFVPLPDGRTIPVTMRGGQMAAPVTSNIVLNTSVNVQGSAGTPDQNSDLAAKVGREMQGVVGSLVTKEISRQLRPGGLIAAGRR